MFTGVQTLHSLNQIRFENNKKERAIAGLLYSTARVAAGLTQAQAGALVDTSRSWWCKCEGYKKMYHVKELVTLRELSGLTWGEFGAIIDEACKVAE